MEAKVEMKGRKRPFGKPVMLTVSRRDYIDAATGREVVVKCPNDIVRTARGGQDNVHHWVRRVVLVARSLAAGYDKVKIRWAGDCEAYDARVLAINGIEVDADHFSCRIKVA